MFRLNTFFLFFCFFSFFLCSIRNSLFSLESFSQPIEKGTLDNLSPFLLSDDVVQITEYLDLEYKKNKQGFIELVRILLKKNKYDVSRAGVLRYLLSDSLTKLELFTLSKDLSSLVMDDSVSNRLSYSALVVYFSLGVIDDNLIGALNYCIENRLKDVFLAKIVEGFKLKMKGTPYESKLTSLLIKKGN